VDNTKIEIEFYPKVETNLTAQFDLARQLYQEGRLSNEQYYKMVGQKVPEDKDAKSISNLALSKLQGLAILKNLGATDESLKAYAGVDDLEFEQEADLDIESMLRSATHNENEDVEDETRNNNQDRPKPPNPINPSNSRQV